MIIAIIVSWSLLILGLLVLAYGPGILSRVGERTYREAYNATCHIVYAIWIASMVSGITLAIYAA